MKCGLRVAIGVGAGYFLGRTKKMKLAMMLGGVAAGRRVGGVGELLGRGGDLLGASPELAALRDQVQGRLMEAGKGVVLALATRQLESLTDRVTQRVERLGDTAAGTAGRAAGTAGRAAGTAGRAAGVAGEDGDGEEAGSERASREPTASRGPRGAANPRGQAGAARAATGRVRRGSGSE